MGNLREKRSGQLAIVEIARENALNAMDRALLTELQTYLHKVEAEGQLRAVIFTGAGTRAFCAGADIKEMARMNAVEATSFCTLGQEVMNLIEEASFLTVGALDGYVLGAGFELALACDLLFATETAQLGFPEVTLGLLPTFGGTQRICRQMDLRIAKDLLLTGRFLSGQEAKEKGIVAELFSKELFLEHVQKRTEEIMSRPETAWKEIKQVISATNSCSFSQGLTKEREAFKRCFATEETQKILREKSHG